MVNSTAKLKTGKYFVRYRALTLCFIIALFIALILCTGCSGSNAPKEKEYVADSEIANVIENPDAYKGKYIVVTGKVFNKVGTDGDKTVWQAFHDAKNSTENFAFTVAGNTTIETNDYVSVDGMIAGTFEGTNAFGAKIADLLIDADSVKVQSYIDAVTPTQSTITPENAVIDQSGMTIRVDKIEFAEQETRLYLTATNNSGSTFDLNSYNAKIVQNGKQFDVDMTTDSTYEGNYPAVSTQIAPSASSSGIIVFPPLDPTMNLQFIVDGYSGNVDVGNYGDLTYTFDIQGKTTGNKLS